MMDGSRLTAAQQWSDGQLVMNGSGLAMEPWTARDERLRDGKMNGLAMERWTARDGRLGNRQMDGSQ